MPSIFLCHAIIKQGVGWESKWHNGMGNGVGNVKGRASLNTVRTMRKD